MLEDDRESSDGNSEDAKSLTQTQMFGILALHLQHHRASIARAGLDGCW